MLAPQSTRGSPRDAPYYPRQRPKKSFEVWCASHSAPSVTNSIHDPRVTGEDGRISKRGKRGRRYLAPPPREPTARVAVSRRREGVVLPDRRRPKRPPREPSRASAQAARGVHGIAQRYWPSTCQAAGRVHDRERP